MATSEISNEKKLETTRGILRLAVQMTAALVIFGALLFLASGRLVWWEGWVYLGLNALTQALSMFILIPNRPEMLAERSKVRPGTKDWDRLLAPAIVFIGTFSVLLTAGLDARFGWSRSMPAGLWWLGLASAFASQMFVLWAMASNPFFAATVRIQSDRGHAVTSSGPYQFIRHPGYLGSLLYNLAIPLVLGSWWTFLPALATILLIILRTGLEDRTLRAELPGYQEYSQRVAYRLLPGVW
ncbi:MAG TPA: isoprenylcysteine carboxylmethyltransferase family protein [Anaerolineales bacterium]|jgi:protein-S-isoprenylcysteine O-methyltransferase Ste14